MKSLSESGAGQPSARFSSVPGRPPSSGQASRPSSMPSWSLSTSGQPSSSSSEAESAGDCGQRSSSAGKRSPSESEAGGGATGSGSTGGGTGISGGRSPLSGQPSSSRTPWTSSASMGQRSSSL